MVIPKTSRWKMAGGSYSGLDRSVYILFAARIINRFGDFVQMLLVLILTVSLGMEKQDAGFFVTLTIMATGVGKLAGGIVADKVPRKYVMVVCQVMVAICYIICGFSTGSPSLFVPILILLSSPFRGATWPVSNALIADFSKGEADRARAYSLLYLGSNIGVAIGPLVAAFLFAHHLPLLFWGAAATMLVSSSIILCFVPPQGIAQSADQTENPDEQPQKGSVLRALLQRPPLLLYMVAFTLYDFIYSQHSFALPLQLGGLLGTVAGTKAYGYVMTVNAVTVLVMTVLLTRLTIHRSRARNMSLATWFYVIGFTMYAFGDSLWIFLLATFIWTNGEILMATNGNVFVNQHAPVSHRARFNGVMSLVTGTGSTWGPYVGGLLLAFSDFRFLWLVMAMLAVGISLLFNKLETMIKRTDRR